MWVEYFMINCATTAKPLKMKDIQRQQWHLGEVLHLMKDDKNQAQ